MPSQKHEFSVFINQLSYLVSSVDPGGDLMLEGDKLFHRLTRVLRLRLDDAVLLFDKEIHARFVIQELQGKTRIKGVVESKLPNTVLYPTIIAWLPLLKRDDCDAALYALTELGINTVRLVTTENVQRAWGGERERERLQRVMIAAAEQSKNFAFPNLYTSVSLDEVCQKAKGRKIFCDPTGVPLFNMLQSIHKEQPEQIDILVGPEGDLVPSEKDLIQKAGFEFCALTPTVLRSVQAVTISCGVIRSILSTPPL